MVEQVVLSALVVLVVVLVILRYAVPRVAADPSYAGQARARASRRRPSRSSFRAQEEVEQLQSPRLRPAVIVNPSKFDDVAAVRDQVDAVCVGAGWAAPLWLETTVEDPGIGQARRAVAEGVALVCALGGDGTVRAVAAGLAGTDTPMGLLPAGTGNLLARNLDLPLDKTENALLVALGGQDKRIDVGHLLLDESGEDEHPQEHAFLVMAGLGFDADTMAGAPEALKSKVGWLAYGVSGMRNLRGSQFRVRMRADGGPEFTRRVRTIVIGNCGRLQGGVALLPVAEIDDGQLDAVALSPKGMAGWVAVAGRVITKRRRGHERVEHFRLKTLAVRTDRPEMVQVDGDLVGPARALSVRVDPGALVVRVG